MTGAPFSESSHKGTTTEGVLSKLFQDLNSSILIPTPVGPMNNENVADPKKPNEIFALRSVVPLPAAKQQKNLMAGTPPPSPLSAAPSPMTAPKTTEALLPPTNIPVKPHQVLAGTLNIKIPVDKQNKPLISKIKDKNIKFIPSGTKITGSTIPLFKVNLS
jgi:hypothetical protein